MTHWVHSLVAGQVTEAVGDDLGDKGASLAMMCGMGLPVPPAFIVSRQAMAHALRNQGVWPEDLTREVDTALATLEEQSGRTLGGDRPLLVAIRPSGPMMDSVLDVGLNDQTVRALAQEGGGRFALDCYRRFILTYAEVVLGVHYTRLVRAQDKVRSGRDLASLSLEELQAVIEGIKATLVEIGKEIPSDPRQQIRDALAGTYTTYNKHRARYHRRKHGIAEDRGAAITVQQMIHGNAVGSSGAGVVHTRDLETGTRGLTGAWHAEARGEDIKNGLVDAWPIIEGENALAARLPVAFSALEEACAQVEREARDAQQIEFTVESGRLWLLQARNPKRSPQAAIQIAVDLVQEGLLTKEGALRRVNPAELEIVLRPIIRPGAHRRVIAKGLDASPGAATGQVVFKAQECVELHERDIPTVLVRVDTSPEDITGMNSAAGFLTARGGHTSHAAVVARSLGKPCIVGCNEIQVDYSRQLFYAGDSVVQRGDWITIDGSTGEVFEGQVETIAPQLDQGAMATLLGWADERAQIKVRANADNGTDARRALQLGAVGVGLCRTEHMFFQADALRAIRRMILAHDPRSRQRALGDILPLQRQMFREILTAMQGRPVTIRLLDPPLHEFLPTSDVDVSAVSADLGVRTETLQARLDQLAETNPMLGHRGVRVGVTTPEVYRTQVRALFEAACELVGAGTAVNIEVMIPLVALAIEIERIRELVVEVAEGVIAEYGHGPKYDVGTMIELPRACLVSDELARHADFFSFGTNDLSQAVFGISRDDMGKFFPAYQREGLLRDSPLVKLDEAGVGRLVEFAVEQGRRANPSLQLGACGEHAGDPQGVSFFHRVGLDYVSCSPYRVPVARLAAALAALGEDGAGD